MAEDTTTDPTVVTANKDAKLDVTVGALLACFVRHPVLLEVCGCVL